MKNVLIAGGNGTIGIQLAGFLHVAGYKVGILLRSKTMASPHYRFFMWDTAKGILDPQALEWADVVVNLAGAGIADKRWTSRRRREILDSRIKPAHIIRKGLEKTGKVIDLYLSASATGYYGPTPPGQPATETTGPGSDFAARVCVEWEAAAGQLAAVSRRVAIARFGIVLAMQGGIVKKLLPVARRGLLSPLGSGRQMMPWIYIDDACLAMIHLIEKEHLSGAFNLVSPHAVSNRDFMAAFARAVKKPLFAMPVPAFALRMMFGEMAGMLLQGNEVSADKLISSGFSFSCDNVDKALAPITGRF